MPSDDVCVIIAKLAGDDPALVILLAYTSKETSATKKDQKKIFKTDVALCCVTFFSDARPS